MKKIKILQVTNAPLTGGAERLIEVTTYSLNKRGIECDIFYLFNPEEIHSRFWPIIRFSPIKFFRLFKKIKNYDVIHGHLFPTLYYLGILGHILNIFKSKKQIIFTEHSNTNRRMGSLIGKLDRFIYSGLNTTISISDEVRDSLNKHFNNKIPCNDIILENGIDIIKISNESAINRTDLSEKLSSQDFLLAQISSFQYPKDHITLIKACSILPNNYKFVFAGFGEKFEETRNYAKKLKVDNRVIFLGKRNDVYKIMKAADVIVLSSEYEGVPMSCLEAMACEKPIIGSNVKGIKDTLNNKEYLFEYQNHIELADLIKKLSNNKLFYSISIEYYKKRKELYDIESKLDTLLLIYRNGIR